MTFELSKTEAAQIKTILSRRANEIAIWKSPDESKVPASVAYALELEIDRLRKLADKLTVVEPEPEE